MWKALLDYNSKENVWLREHKKQLMIGAAILDVGMVACLAYMIAKNKHQQNAPRITIIKLD